MLAVTVGGLNHAPAASIGTPTYSSVSDSTPPNWNLTTIGVQDWQIYGGGSINQISEEKQNGVSITMAPPVIVSPCVPNSFYTRSAQTFTWTDGAPDSAGTSNNPTDNGFAYANAATVAYGVNYETITFVPGDTNLHTLHLYGYFDNNNSGVRLQFTASLPGASSVVTNPPSALGDFDYSVSFQADNSNDALTVVFTFQKTDGSGTAKWIGINAAAMTGTSPNSPVTVFPPSSLDALGGEGVVNLNWSPNSANTVGFSYKVYRNTTGSLTNYQLIATGVTDTNYNDTTVIVGSNYFYAVTTVSNGQESAFSNQDGAEPFMVHTGDVLVVNGDSANTATKTWTLSSLNNTNPTVTGTAGTTTGAFTSAGGLGAGDSFSFTVSSVMNWSGTAAQAALLTNGFGGYLNSLPAGKIGVFQFNLGVDSTAINPGDNAGALNGTNEALVYTFSTSNLSTGRLFLTSFNFANYLASASTDFVIYDSAGNQVTVQYWNQNYSSSTYGGIAYNSEFLIQNGYKIVVGTGASNTNSSWRASSPQLDIVTGATVPPDLTLAQYVYWAASYGGTALIGSPTNDYDGDGLANLMEYALGGNPTNNLDTGTAPTLIYTNGTLLFIYSKRCDNANLIYSIQSSTNLTNWANASYTVTGTNVTGGILNYITNAIATNGLPTYYRLTVQADNLLVSSTYSGVTPHFTGAQPAISVNFIGLKNVILNGNVGEINAKLPYWIRSTTNMALPLSQWDWVCTNVFNPDGSFSNALPVTPGQPQLFYRLQTQ
jgi:hypothetical protein